MINYFSKYDPATLERLSLIHIWDLVPVPGWQADPSFLWETFKGERMSLRSYHVWACPQFEADLPRTPKGGKRR